MRAFLRATPVALLLLASVTGSASAQKLGYIRSSVLLEQAPGRAEAEGQFDRETAGFREQIKRMQDSLNVMVSGYEKSREKMTPAARDARAKELQTRDQEYQRRTRELEQKAQARQAELVQPILDRVKASIEDVRVEGGYSFIFNMEQGTNILAADKNLDITDRVLAKLRSASATARPAPSAPAAAPAGVVRPATPPID